MIFDASTHEPLRGGASFPLSHRLLRALWGVVWTVFGQWTPVPLHGWRRALARAFGAKVDRHARIYPGVRIWYPPNLTMAAYATLGPRADCYCMASITMETFALVSQGAYLCAGTHDIDDPNFQLQARSIVIASRAWIAAEAFVGPGVVVGEGAVLGARAVTVKNLEPWGVYVGNPARRIRNRAHALLERRMIQQEEPS